MLPEIEDIPNIKKVTYLKTQDEYKETYYTEKQIQSEYNNAIYSIVMTYMKVIFALGNTGSLIEFAVVNGIRDTIDRTNGKRIRPYVISVSCKLEDFLQINLEHVDAKAWFKKQKGLSASTFTEITPIAPVISIATDDERFVEGYSVIQTVNEGMNLAAMDWQDFENLVRDLFEREFNQNGGMVKITQASRDGGVDAVAFDPDPIRGGKIVIQAKRYVNTVPVSAVRDLYGTLINEGANKGILITTSDFGGDSIEFSKGKPITLLNGANLLSLLEKHGRKARIDIEEARVLMNS